ncbi:MAG: HAMP domain-containing protein [Hyphomicrobiaceae bacterium]
MELLVADFNGDRHLRAFLMDANKHLIMTSQLTPPEEDVPEWLFKLLGGQPKSITIKLPPTFNGHGAISLQTDSHNEVGEVRNDAKLYLTILAVFCGLVLILLYVILGRALRPLQELTVSFAQIGRGDYQTRVLVRAPREIAQLESGFNQMAAQLLEMEQRNGRLREQLETVQEEERVELARNLHDEVSPLLFSVEVDAMTIRQHATGGRTAEIPDLADAIQGAVANMKTNVKAILGQLRPAGLAELSLGNSIENLVSFWLARHPEISFSVNIPDGSWGPQIDSAIHSIVRESLSNSMKHTKPSQVGIHVEDDQKGYLSVVIMDNGCGLKSPQPTSGYGVIGMKERATLLGGRLTVEDRIDGPGVVVRALVPISVNQRPQSMGEAIPG